jgi:hypothetical protein
MAKRYTPVTATAEVAGDFVPNCLSQSHAIF